MARMTGTHVFDDECIENRHIDSDTDIDCDKLEQHRKPGTNLGFAIGATPTTREELVFVASASGTIRGFHALCVDTGTSASVTFDLKKNGTTVLSAVITITNATTDAQVQDATVSVTSFVADDRLSIAMTVSSSTGMVGPFAWAEISETTAAS